MLSLRKLRFSSLSCSFSLLLRVFCCSAKREQQGQFTDDLCMRWIASIKHGTQRSVEGHEEEDTPHSMTLNNENMFLFSAMILDSLHTLLVFFPYQIHHLLYFIILLPWSESTLAFATKLHPYLCKYSIPIMFLFIPCFAFLSSRR